MSRQQSEHAQGHALPPSSVCPCSQPADAGKRSAFFAPREKPNGPVPVRFFFRASRKTEQTARCLVGFPRSAGCSPPLAHPARPAGQGGCVSSLSWLNAPGFTKWPATRARLIIWPEKRPIAHKVLALTTLNCKYACRLAIS